MRNAANYGNVCEVSIWLFCGNYVSPLEADLEEGRHFGMKGPWHFAKIRLWKKCKRILPNLCSIYSIIHNAIIIRNLTNVEGSSESSLLQNNATEVEEMTPDSLPTPTSAAANGKLNDNFRIHSRGGVIV